jgi:hypothetical protein
VRRARLAMGGIQQVMEECRDSRGVSTLTTMWQDIQYGFRVLRKSSLVVSLRDPATDEILTISRGSFEVFLETGASEVSLTNLFQLNGRDLVVNDLARLVMELLKADSNRIVIHAEASLGRQWQSTFRLPIPLK